PSSGLHSRLHFLDQQPRRQQLAVPLPPPQRSQIGAGAAAAGRRAMATKHPHGDADPST
uniref:Uncharacterized protein n=1 Tax=Aegilops tauschii subsp. strangulata TaxID=200361 RepID=A0A453N5H9_AEGTS